MFTGHDNFYFDFSKTVFNMRTVLIIADKEEAFSVVFSHYAVTHVFSS